MNWKPQLSRSLIQLGLCFFARSAGPGQSLWTEGWQAAKTRSYGIGTAGRETSAGSPRWKSRRFAAHVFREGISLRPRHSADWVFGQGRERTAESTADKTQKRQQP